MQRLARAERLAVVVAVAALVTLVLAAGLTAGVFRGYRAEAVDALFPAGHSDDRVAVVAIDRAALTETGARWPWPRDLQARLLTAIAAQHPAVIAFDVIYDPATPDDSAFAAAVRAAGAPVVLAQASQLTFSADGRLFVGAHTAIPVSEIGSAAAVVGDSAITPDAQDGVVRTVPITVESADGAFVPALSLATLAAFDGSDPFVVLRPHGVQIGARTVPTEDRGRLRIAYSSGLTGRGVSASTVSAADLLADRTARDRLTDKIVFVGVTDPTLGDTHTTPVDKAGAPGVYVHANALNTMLTAAWLSPVSQIETTLWIALLAIVVAGAATLRRLWLAPIIAGLLAAVYFVIVSLRFDSGTEMDILYPLAGVGLAFVGGLAARYLLSTYERRRMIGVLEQYVPTPVAQQLLTRTAHGLPSGEITFLFTDVVGSSELWEQEPKAMSAAMHRHDQLVDDAVEHAGGAVVRPRGEGDSRFAVFVSPVDAVHAAVAVNRALDRERWTTDRPICVRVGVHTGGAELRAGDYYGTDVNRCARIRSLAGPGEIFLSETTALAVHDHLDRALRDRGEHELKGIEGTEHVYELPWREPSPLAT